MPVAGVAALGSLYHLDLKPGERLVITGASGGVGGYAVQIARPRGVHVIGTAFGNTEEAAGLGAAEVYDAQKVDVFNAIREAHPEDVDAVFDLVNGKDRIGRSAGMIRSGGRLVSSLNGADEKWFADRQIRAFNLGATPNPMSSFWK